MIRIARYLFPLFVLTWPALLVLAQDIDTLRYTSVPRGVIGGHAIPTAQGCNIAKMQQFLRTGIDGEPLSPQYVLILADELDGRGGEITRFHGISSPRLIWQLLHDSGAPPQSFCTTLFTRVTPAMNTAAAPYKVGELVGYETLGTYQLAVAHLAANPGSALLLSTDGYDCKAVIGVRGGLSVWLEYPKPGPPVVVLRDEAAGEKAYREQLEGQVNGPEHYFLAIDSR